MDRFLSMVHFPPWSVVVVIFVIFDIFVRYEFQWEDDRAMYSRVVECARLPIFIFLFRPWCPGFGRLSFVC